MELKIYNISFFTAKREEMFIFLSKSHILIHTTYISVDIVRAIWCIYSLCVFFTFNHVVQR